MRSIFAAAVALVLLASAARGGGYGGRVPQLIDQRGHAFTISQLLGRPLAVSFVSAHCSDVCPLVEAQIAQAAHYERSVHGKLLLLTITLDPERDSHADMVRLARKFDADPAYWLIASGTRADVHRVMQAFGVVTARGPDGYADAHTTFITILGSDGRVAGALLPSTQLWQQLLREENV
jgi:protein SCO1